MEDPHYRQAVAEAQELFKETPIPPDAVGRGGGPPETLSGPVTGAPSSDHVIDVMGLWNVPMSMAATLGWLGSHPPQGLASSGSAEGGGPEGSFAGSAFSASPTDAYLDAQLELGVTADGPDRSVLRADGIDVWITTTPAPDLTDGPRVRVTLAGGCPTQLGGVVDVSNVSNSIMSQMLPAADPVAGLVCLYGSRSGLTSSPQRADLADSVDLSATNAGRLAQAVNAIRLGSTGTGATSCPVDFDLVDVVVLAYTAHSDVDLWYHASGCETLDNGFVVASEGANPSFSDGFVPLITSLTG
ncbi:MAG TPA: hypothetical protein DCQ30_07055 [Acidimicrobiaceae bacterium]|nr:hypothetical protein [Acidimicrobiaceae bacterium]